MARYAGFGVRGSGIYEPSRSQISKPGRPAPQLLPGFVEVAGTVYDKTGTGALDATASGADQVTAVETGAAVSAGTASGPDAVTRIETGTAITAGTASGADAVTTVETGTGQPAATASGERSTTRTETGTGIVILSGSDLDTNVFVRSGGGALGSTATGASAVTRAEPPPVSVGGGSNSAVLWPGGSPAARTHVHRGGVAARHTVRASKRTERTRTATCRVRCTATGARQFALGRSPAVSQSLSPSGRYVAVQGPRRRREDELFLAGVL